MDNPDAPMTASQVLAQRAGLEGRVAELEAWRAAIMPCLDIVVELVTRVRASKGSSISQIVPLVVPEGVVMRPADNRV